MAVLEHPSTMSWDAIVKEMDQMKANPQIYDSKRESILANWRIRKYCSLFDLPAPGEPAPTSGFTVDQFPKDATVTQMIGNIEKTKTEKPEQKHLSLNDPNHPSNIPFTGIHTEHSLGNDANKIAEHISKLPPGSINTIRIVTRTGKNRHFNIKRNSPDKSHEYTFYIITRIFGCESNTNYDCEYAGMLSHVTRILDC